jgi:HPt (histidine-containing phosphotransfer) domain-containing protein
MTEEPFTVEVDSELADLIPKFLANRNKDLDDIDRALVAKDFTQLRIIGHNMKGVGGGYGFDAITEFGIHIESAAKHGDLKAIEGYLIRYRAYLAHLEVRYV